MDLKYARFVAYASIVAHDHIQSLLRGRKAVPALETMRDAARLGVRKARERIFPGLARDPFKANPLDDVLLGLRYHYEGDPENYGEVLPSSSFANGNAPSSALPAPARPQPGPADSQVRQMSDTQNRKLSDTQARSLTDSQRRALYPFSPAPKVPEGSET